MAPKILQTHNLPPLPKVLPTLGEIALDNWQCLAELVDNAIDGFRPPNANLPKSPEPEVDILLSPKGMDGKPEVVVVDNGPGMTVAQMCNAATAGYSSRTDEDAGYLGLFGMGLNVAMARLGERTEIWTKTRGKNSQPSALIVDFKEMQRIEKFAMPRIQIDPGKTAWRIVKASDHFTAIRVTDLRGDVLDLLNCPESIEDLRKKLGEVYSPILTRSIPIPLALRVNGSLVEGHRHNIWRATDAGAGKETWIGIDHAVPRGRVHGWIGLQRFTDLQNYGIDFIRNGRKIEMHDKELFSCLVTGEDPLEYPIDKRRQGGRIVGEIHIDHCRVPFTKTRFYREDAAWTEMVQIVRGGVNSPMRPEVARRNQLSKNNSPLATLYSRFRRNEPHFGANKPLDDTSRAKKWRELLVFPDNERAVKLAHCSPMPTDDEWLAELDKDIRKRVVEGKNVRPRPVPGPRPAPMPTPPKPKGALKYFEGLPSESALIKDPFVKAVLEELQQSLDEAKYPIAFCLCVRALVEVALSTALRQQSPEIWKDINEKGPRVGLQGILQKLNGKERIFEDDSVNGPARAFVRQGMSNNSVGKFLNEVGHGHVIANKDDAKALARTVAKLMHALLGKRG